MTKPEPTRPSLLRRIFSRQGRREYRHALNAYRSARQEALWTAFWRPPMTTPDPTPAVSPTPPSPCPCGADGDGYGGCDKCLGAGEIYPAPVPPTHTTTTEDQ